MIQKIVPLLSVIVFSHSAHASELEVLHWWTSSGEAQSAQLLKESVETKGHHWKDFAIAGGGGKSAMLVLKARAVSGNPPSAAQIKGHDIQEWAQLGFLAELDSVATAGNWNQILPPVVADTMKYKGHYVAAPINIHRSNWLWVNSKILQEVGVDVPVTLDEFFSVADKIKAAGYIPLAHGGQAWQDATLFETVALAILGADEYKQAFVALNNDTLSSDNMVDVLRQFKKMRQYIDSGSASRQWNEATEMVIEGTAAMQIMGDWAKGEFTAAGKRPNVDYRCVPSPGTAGMFSYNIDSFVFFKSASAESKPAQFDLASSMLSKDFQKAFNLAKGSLPTRNDLPVDDFDQCAQLSHAAFVNASQHQGLLPSLSQGMSSTSYVQDAINEVVSDYFNDDDESAESAAQRLARVIKAAK
ncbi:ABC transporter substrate-binding protein [Vibrio sp. RC27]